MIELQGLSFRYPDCESPVIDRLDLTIPQGEWLLISGSSGCGKSTLALALAGFLGRTIPGELNGKILIDGKDIHEMEMHEISEKVYLVQQNSENQFCTLTVRDELAFGLENRCLPVDEIQARIHLALKSVQAEALINRRIEELSGGQQQKIAIATALALLPNTLILDEPTSNLDADALNLLIRTLSDLRSQQKMTVVIIEHRTEILKALASRHLEMQQGQLFAGVEASTPTPGLKPAQNAKYGLLEASEKLVELNNHQVNFENRPILNIDRFELHSGEIVSLMGPNGSGKTTFLLSILGLVKSESESNYLLGCQVTKKLSRGLLSNFGLAFQNPDHQIFCETVQDEVFLGRENYKLALNESSWIEHLIGAFGFDQLRNRHPYLLSYGQKGRLNIAAILAYKPRVLLLDEIFIGQDLDNVHFILQTIRNYVNEHQAGAIIVNHLTNPVLRYSDRLLFMKNGKFVVNSDATSVLLDSQRLGLSEHLEAYVQAG